jgi:hypothetical protein
MAQRSQVAQRVQHRPGEGHVIDMTVVSADSDSMMISLDMGALPVPERKYACDAVQVVGSRMGARLLLGQSKPVTRGLLSMLVLNISPEPAMQFVRSVDNGFLGSARNHLELHSAQEVTTSFADDPPQTVILTGSYVLAGFSGLTGCMDFYYASPFSLQQMAALKKLALEPVVRVNLSTGLMVAMIDALSAAAAEFGWENLVKGRS